MKRAITALLSCALILMLVPHPALAADVTLTREHTDALCTEFFAEGVCAELGDEWEKILTQDVTAGEMKTFARAAVSTARTRGGDIPCEAIFSERVCQLIRDIGEIASDPVGFVLGIVVIVRDTVRELGDEVVKQIVCTIDPNNPVCWYATARAGGDVSADDVCREVFSDAVCDTIENPGPTIAAVILWVWNTVRCYLDPTCSPIIITCGPTICPDRARPSFAR